MQCLFYFPRTPADNHLFLKGKTMKVLKSYIQLTSLVLSFVFTNAVLAVEPAKDESKDNATGNTISSADLSGNTNTDAAPALETQTKTVVDEQQSGQPQTMTDAQSFRQEMDERRRQMQEAQLEAYKRHLERRKQYFANKPVPAYDNPEFDNSIPAYIQERRNEYIKQMEERRAMNVKMMEQNRKAAEERRKTMQLKMHQTCAPELVQKA